MCDVLDKVENRGIAKGKIEGEMEGKAQVTTLMKKLFEQNRIHDTTGKRDTGVESIENTHVIFLSGLEKASCYHLD